MNLKKKNYYLMLDRFTKHTLCKEILNRDPVWFDSKRKENPRGQSRFQFHSSMVQL